jgi:hypothetical protein
MANIQMTKSKWHLLGVDSADVLTGVDQDVSGMVIGSPVQVNLTLTPSLSYLYLWGWVVCRAT